MHTKVISAFPGTGKTWFVDNSNLKCLDSDSSKFDKNGFPWNYIEHIKDNIGKYDYIFVSSHDVVRDALVHSGINFICIYPDMSCKKEYMQRYHDRGSAEGLIKMIEGSWQNWIEDLDCAFQFPTIRLTKGLYISDIFTAHQPKDTSGMQWIKASERLPTGRGYGNSVIIRGDGFDKDPFGHSYSHPFLAKGFVNFNEKEPRFYFTIGNKSFLTNEGIEWLDESSPLLSTQQGERGCNICGGELVLIRGKYPKEDKRKVCPTCNTERLEQINEISSKSYGVAFQENKTPINL